jgi:hypothetical protein
MKLLLIPLFLVFTLPGFSQSGKALIKFSPAALIDDPSFPAIQAAVEFKLTGQYTMQAEAGIKYRKSEYQADDTIFVPARGFRIKTEIRRYFNSKNAALFNDIYLAANIFFVHVSHNTGIGYYYQKDSTMERSDHFGVRKNILGLNVLFGQQKIIRGRFYFDVYGGIGVRFRTINTTGREYDRKKDQFIITKDLNVHNFRSRAEADDNAPFMPNLTVGIRICYML